MNKCCCQKLHVTLFYVCTHQVHCEMANGNIGHDQGIGIILCFFNNCPIIYLVGPVYYCPGYPSNMISSGAVKFYAGFQNFTSETLEHCGFADPRGLSCRSSYHTQNNLNYIKIKIFKVKPQRNRNIFVPTVWSISKHNPSRLIHQCFGSVYIASLKWIARKVLIEGLPKNLPDLDYPWPILSWPRQLKLPEVQTLMSQNLPLGSCFKWIFHFSMLKSSVGLPSIFRLYVLLLNTSLYFRT